MKFFLVGIIHEYDMRVVLDKSDHRGVGLDLFRLDFKLLGP